MGAIVFLFIGYFMSIPLSLLQRAKQGDAVAIAVLMNDALQAQDVWVKATRANDCLQVMLKAPTVLHQAHCIAFMRRGLLRLQPAAINQVTAYAWRVGDVFPLWIAAFSLEPTLLPRSQLDTQLKAVVEPSSADRSRVQFASKAPVSEAPVPLQQSAPQIISTNAARQRSEIFKLGFVIVLMTIVYLMVTGV